MFTECQNAAAGRWREKCGFPGTAIQVGKLPLELQEQLALPAASQGVCVSSWKPALLSGRFKKTVQSTGGKEASFMFFCLKRTLNKCSFKCSLLKYPFKF